MRDEQDTLQLAKAMGLEIYSRGADTYPLRKLHNNLMQPFSPLTDANDDCAVLEWAKADTNRFSDFKDAMYELAGSSRSKCWPWQYKIGNNARAALKMLTADDDNQ